MIAERRLFTVTFYDGKTPRKKEQYITTKNDTARIRAYAWEKANRLSWCSNTKIESSPIKKIGAA